MAKLPAPDLWRSILLPALLSGVAALGLSRLPVFQAFENVVWDGLVRLRAEDAGKVALHPRQTRQ
ncbi:MAG: hypothetical protein ACKOTE_08555, partial [Opitutaceae bacterium]